MIDEPPALEVAKGAFESKGVVLGCARELSQGWSFPCVTKGIQIFAGVIVNMATCRPLLVMTHSPMASDLTLYDRGYQFDQYDLVVLTVENFDETVRVLHPLNVVTLDTYYKNDRVYRVGAGSPKPRSANVSRGCRASSAAGSTSASKRSSRPATPAGSHSRRSSIAARNRFAPHRVIADHARVPAYA
jgi:hypothetical protein